MPIGDARWKRLIQQCVTWCNWGQKRRDSKYTDPQDILGKHGLLKSLTKRAVERVLEAELTAHLGYAPHVRHGTEEQNARNGKG